ncbi:DUF2804 family protein [Treponema phagedenis]|uniref:DUF2804 family protein n=1 Tax=Treponema phagedenis TaxID=162 RepID=A0A0B7GUL0_TREPH|nr:DUF2804 domain-containing protein [Treponema phagedenis]EFW37232.1 hypothetical protein HMPREF9554_02288 [Treponema phagedenis F0421]NVP23735.1 DUF2804 family protein [Treponema phagedenis]QEJ94445.1 DUF2804 family protein [Treponema phagedenis]QEJ97509.1 DUF2804 family protein [Treponema phagedenis]QEK01676.1 DUF2804 family protein [Treponema phagedenis]
MAEQQQHLYTRKISPAPDLPVKNGVPLFGSYSGWFKKFDIRGLKRPFGNLPIPVFLTNRRIISSMRFMFCNADIIGEMEFFSAGYFSFMETNLWQRKTNKRFSYRKLLPGGFMHLPKSIAYSVTACRTKKRYARIFSRLLQGMMHIDFDFSKSRDRPACEGRLDFYTGIKGAVNLSSVIPYQVRRRCQTTYLHCGTVNGWVSFGFNEDIHLDKNLAPGFFEFRNTYMPARMKRTILIGLGYIDRKLISFQLANSVAPDSYSYNDNILFYDGKRVPLPPVRITRPYGTTGVWIIQDTERMVDLTFTPISQSKRTISALILHADYNTIYGTFDGTLLTSTGEAVKLKNFAGIGKRIRMRI